jgi:hypothetical protein
MPALYPIPGFSTHPDHIRTHTISPHKPGSAREKLKAERLKTEKESVWVRGYVGMCGERSSKRKTEN